MKKLVFSLLLFLMVFAAPGIFMPTADAGKGPVIFMDAEFAKLLAEAWNNSSLPVRLGSQEVGGSGWINTPNKYTGEAGNKQVIIMSRRDCPYMAKVQLTIENRQGKAVCTYGGAMTENYERAEWAFSPTTAQWYKFASGDWGYMQMPGIMNGFRGPMFVARANISNFGEFWKVAGHVAKNVNADYTSSCPVDNGDQENIREYLNKIR